MSVDVQLFGGPRISQQFLNAVCKNTREIPKMRRDIGDLTSMS